MRDLFSSFVLFLGARYVQIRYTGGAQRAEARHTPPVQISECAAVRMQAVIPRSIEAAGEGGRLSSARTCCIVRDEIWIHERVLIQPLPIGPTES